MSPGELVKNGKRRLLAEEHIVYAIVLLAVVFAATIYAVYNKDKSGNVWIVYGAVVAGIFGRSSPRPPSKERNDESN